MTLALHVFSVPLRTEFRGLAVREGVVIEGPFGWGEFAPFREYDDVAAARWWASAVEASTTAPPTALRQRIPINATVPAVPANHVADVLAQFSGCMTAKVKVADRLSRSSDSHKLAVRVGADLDRLRAVRDVLGPNGAIRIDVNGGWDLDTAIRLLPHYDDAAGGLEYVEQPCRDVYDLASLRRSFDIPIAADESIRLVGNAQQVIDAEAADVAVLKVAPLGGVRRCLQIAEQVQAAGLTVVVSSALDTSVGMAQGLALAAALPELTHACGLGTTALLGGDLVTHPPVIADGAVQVYRPHVEPHLLASWAADAATDAWWRARVARVQQLVAGPAVADPHSPRQDGGL